MGARHRRHENNRLREHAIAYNIISLPEPARCSMQNVRLRRVHAFLSCPTPCTGLIILPCAISKQNLTIIIIRFPDHIRIGLDLILSRCRCSLSCRCSQTRTRAPPRQRRTSSRVGYRTCRMTPRSFTHPTGCHSGDCTPAVTSTTPTNAILASLTSLAACPHVTFDWIGSFQGAGHVCSLTTTTNHRGQTLDLVFA